MSVLVLGVNHRTASVAVRERLAVSEEQCARVLQSGRQICGLRELAVLSTCNRTEVYAADEAPDGEALLQWLAAEQGIPMDALRPCIYQYEGEAAARHMMRVASGLDSLVLGEPQILGQLKDAFSHARAAQSLGTELGRLFEHTFGVAKRVRTDTAIGENPVSVAYAAVAMAKHIFSDMAQSRALLIGAGRTIELVARHLREVGVAHIVVANRTLERAERVARSCAGEAILLSEIPDNLARADIVISSTASPLPILGKGAVERALRKRKHKPMFMVDIAVPRDIESEVARLDDVYLYTVDDLQQVIQDNVRSREGAAQEAEHLIEAGAADYMYQLRALDSVAVLKQFRSQAERARDVELAKASRALASGQNPEQVLQLLARALTRKLVHEPTVSVRRAAADGRTEVADWLRELYNLQHEEGAAQVETELDKLASVTPLHRAGR
ncbi:MAG: glutamyl-tRNA reductase [Alteromonadaceae bacterium]|nr:glutamyl-tRNA reductase [Alteromonadaceae bacterium]